MVLSCKIEMLSSDILLSTNCSMGIGTPRSSNSYTGIRALRCSNSARAIKTLRRSSNSSKCIGALLFICSRGKGTLVSSNCSGL